MENVAFYREWLPLNKKEFRILAMLADFGGEYHGNLTDMCRYFSVSPQHKNREALREAIQHLADRHYIESSVNGRTYSLRIIPKEKEIALPREWFERVRTREYSSESVSWEAVIKLLLWLIAHNPEVMITNQQIADDLDVSVSVVVSAKNVLEKDFEAIPIGREAACQCGEHRWPATKPVTAAPSRVYLKDISSKPGFPSKPSEAGLIGEGRAAK